MRSGIDRASGRRSGLLRLACACVLEIKQKRYDKGELAAKVA